MNNIIFDPLSIYSYGGAAQDRNPNLTVSSDGTSMQIVGNGWKAIKLPYTITANTVLEFDFKSTAQGEIQGIGFDEDLQLTAGRHFQVYGTDTYGKQNFNNYKDSVGEWKHYRIRVGDFYSGNMNYLFFANDHDVSNPTAASIFANVRVYEDITCIGDNLTTNEDQPIIISVTDLLKNDLGKNLKLVGVDNPVGGSVSFIDSQSILFTPNPDFNGVASFRYTVEGADQPGEVRITVNPVNDAPIANPDGFSINKNTNLTLGIADILNNDTDIDGDSLSLVGVSNPLHGSISFNGSNLVFTPESNFTGEASFEYSISDGIKTASATVTVTVNPTTESGIRLGVNSAPLNYWSSQVSFLDAFRTSRSWITQTQGVFDTKESALLDLDKNGWVKSLPAPEDAPLYTYVTTVMYNGIDGKYPGGKYVVLYEGEGTITYKGDAKKDTLASTLGRDVINVTPSGTGIQLSITATDPNKTGNYIRNIRVVPQAYESSYTTDPFNPDWVDKVDSFEAYRFMDWMKTNGSTQKEWSDRPTLDSSTWSVLGAPVEIMVEMANKLDIDPWFCMPHQASNDYVTQFATYVRDNLEPERKVYVEYSNEVWNGAFPQYNWVKNQSLLDPTTKSWVDWFSKRTTEVTRIWDQVFGDQKERVIGVMGAQASNIWTGTTALDYRWDTQSHSHDYYGIDAIAIAPYFGGYLGRSTNASQVQNWTVDQLFDELTQGGVLSGGPTGGALQDAYNNMSQYAQLAKSENLQLLAYEGGQHLAAVNSVNQIKSIVDLFTQANRDPRMGDIYQQYLNKWNELGGGLFMAYNDIYRPGSFGNWGMLENIYQTSSPKYDAMMALLNSSPQVAQ